MRDHRAGVASLIGVDVGERSRVAGRLIKDISIPGERVVAAIIRNREFVVPRGNTQLEAGDRVIFVDPATAIKQAQEYFLAKKAG